MYFRIKTHVALRSWKGLRGAVYLKGQPYARGVTAEELSVLKLCDGEHDIQEDGTTAILIQKDLIEPCRRGEHPSEWSAYRCYENRYFPKMNLMITGKCNYNCLHCFNAADNAPLMTEWSYEELLNLLDQAKDCGIHALTITGGEPMLHPRFMDFVAAVYERGMFIEELNTNGAFIDQQKLDAFHRIGCDPLIKISFDGIGCHDWMRNRPGAEKKTLAAMELCIQNGFQVLSQTQVNRKNVHTLMDTARVLNEMGVSALRLIRTTETARWTKNAPDSSLSIQEYFAQMFDLANAYRDSGMTMKLIIWQLMRMDPLYHTVSFDPIKSMDGTVKWTDPVCKGNRGMVAVTSSGEVIPCLQMSGYFEENGIHLGNLHQTPLKDFLNEGEYLDVVCTSLHQKLSSGSRCAACANFKYCHGGCPALGLLFTGSLNGEDPTKCVFFEQGWYQKALDFQKTYSGGRALCADSCPDARV